jgi:hypothetical protein
MTPGAPLCRWRHGEDVLDVMAVEEKVHGLKGAWYLYGMRTALVHQLAEDLDMRICRRRPSWRRSGRHSGIEGAEICMPVTISRTL